MAEKLTPKQEKDILDAREHLMKGAAEFARSRGVDLWKLIKGPSDVTLKLSFDEDSQDVVQRGAVGKLIDTVYKRRLIVTCIELCWPLKENLAPLHDNLLNIEVEAPLEDQTPDGMITIPRSASSKADSIRVDPLAKPITYAVEESDVFARLGLRQRRCVPRTLQPQVIWEIGNILGGMQGEFDPDNKLKQRLRRLFPDKFPTPRLPYGEIISGRRG